MLDRLTQSLEAAQGRVQGPAREIRKGTRDVLKDLDTTLNDARRNLRSVSKTATQDLEKVQQALITGLPPPTRAAHPHTSVSPATTGRSATTAAKKRERRPCHNSSQGH